ncbi:MAG: inositol 2-dehydrogenase [Trueperaceae bacterium]|nr:MAG: inositol 2-dehydrogenase [Trueperaceae bacterium]
MMLNICLLGAGFIGKVHAENLVGNPEVGFAGIFDPDQRVAALLAERHGVPTLESVDAVMEDRRIDAVLIATPAGTHPTLIRQASEAGKAIFCEKPIGKDLVEVDACLEALEGYDRPVQIGFNRRFDPQHRALYTALQQGEIGAVEQLIITSRDPHPPPVTYMRDTPGGVFYDTMCHDFDTARWLLGEEPIEVYAVASSLLEEDLNPDRDLDTAMALLRTASGKMCHINVSRRSVYGHDQRIEVFGSKGMLQSQNIQRSRIRRYGSEEISEEVLLDFFIDRYREAYVQELQSFVDASLRRSPVEVTIFDGRQSLALSLAALDSSRRGQPVHLTDPSQ